MSAETKTAEGAPNEAKATVSERNERRHLGKVPHYERAAYYQEAGEMARNIGFVNLEPALEKTRTMLTPLVDSFDQEIGNQEDFRQAFREGQHKERVLMLYPYRCDHILMFGLCRDGSWRMRVGDELAPATSRQLADEIRQNRHLLINQSINEGLTDEQVLRLADLGLAEIAEQRVIVHLLNVIDNRLNALIAEKKKRLEALEDRVCVHEVFGQYLDPVQTARPCLTMPNHAVMQGGRILAQGYFSDAAIAPFLKVTSTWNKAEEYRPYLMRHSIKALDNIIVPVARRLRGIELAQDRQRVAASDLLGYTGDGALELIPEEEIALRQLAQQVKDLGKK